MFKIRNKDGLFSNGGTWPEWTKTGKVWRQRGHLSNHLAQVSRNIYSETDVIVEFEMIEISTVLLSDYEADRLERGKERKDRQAQERLDCRRDYLERELTRVKGELDNLK